ncbi:MULTISPECIES: CaiB/BaiF CoA-transferase family protein [unclassified Chelatococcus]|uniref:CaiB/BaiF CoA transferase family protein n=1 Tax=unclassified Chelatococcus TaxID=2638111 RepID=UPI001BCAB962|nr:MULTISPECIES: CaiB/BaiF CoA-transferase family protein [unclassified Chelatococcus]MBS7700169.1 CoA transferase [Chelatococcus sp. YT9]MBX3556862.1 CoA transferase [Chelatococcus sp.]
MRAEGAGPLAGIRVVEFAALGPAPFAAMLMADMGADVLRIDRPGSPGRDSDILNRGRASLVVDIKDPDALASLRRIIDVADVLIEGFRPGVMERNGLGPDVVCAANPRLIYLRMTGWGQGGPLAERAGHDINYIAVAGALAPIGRAGQPPVPPLNLVGDFGGGSMFAALGIVAALYEREKSGRGQIIDAAMVDGTANLMAMYLSHQQGGREGTGLESGAYFLDGSAPYYRCYACADGRYVAVGAIEPAFWRILLETSGVGTGLSQEPDDWPEASAQLEALFLTRDRDDWIELFEGRDACIAPVLTYDELESHAHLAARGTYVRQDGLLQPAPAPRFSRSRTRIAGKPSQVGAGGDALAASWLSSPPIAHQSHPVTDNQGAP